MHFEEALKVKMRNLFSLLTPPHTFSVQIKLSHSMWVLSHTQTLKFFNWLIVVSRLLDSSLLVLLWKCVNAKQIFAFCYLLEFNRWTGFCSKQQCIDVSCSTTDAPIVCECRLWLVSELTRNSISEWICVYLYLSIDFAWTCISRK